MREWEQSPYSGLIDALYANSEQPVAVINEKLLVVWANGRALAFYDSLRLPDGVRGMLTEELAHSAASDLGKGKTVLVRSGLLPLSSTGIFFTPLERWEGGFFALAHLRPAQCTSEIEEPLEARRMVAAVSSQIRAPLSRIFTSLSQLAKSREVIRDNRLLAPLKNISQGSYRILRHCVNLTEYTKFTSAANTPALQEADVGALVQALASAARQLMLDSGIPLECRPPRAACYGMCDVGKLQTALLNILSNAYKFTRSGNRIVLSVSLTAAAVVVSVADRGLGMPPDVLLRACEPFFTYGGEDPDSAGGGLGLSVAKLCVECQRGSIAIRSTPGAGTTVTLSLPRAAPQLTLAALREEDFLCDRFSPLYVLLADVCPSPWP